MEGRGAKDQAIGACVAEAVPPAAKNRLPVAAPMAARAVSGGRAADPDALVGRLAEAPAGAGLASLVEELLAGLLVAARGDRDEAQVDEADVEVTEVLDVPELDGVLEAVTSPADRSLAQAAGALGVDWGEGTGIDALAALGGEVLSELVTACHRLGAWAAWAEAVAAACLARTAEMNRGTAPWGPDGVPQQLVTEDERRFTTTNEIACRLGVARATAGRIVDRGQVLLRPEFALTEVLHRSGLLDQSKTTLIARRLDDVDTGVAAAVQERVLARAPRRTASQLGRDIDRALAALDPEGGSSLRRRDVAGRHVTRPRQAGEGTHEMRLLLPSLDAFLLDATLDAIAASARAAGDQRSLGQLRADAITGMTLRTLQGSQHVACRSEGGALEPDGADTGDVGLVGRSPAFPVSGTDDPAPAVSGTDDSGGAEDSGVVPVGVGAGASGHLLPDGVPLEGLLASLSGLVDSTHPWWTPSGIEPVFPPPGITVNVDLTVPLNMLVPGVGQVDDEPPQHHKAASDTSQAAASPNQGSSVAVAVVDYGSSVPSARGSLCTPGGPSPSAGGGPGLPAHTQVAEHAQIAEHAQVAEVVIGGNSLPVPTLTARALAAGGVWRRLVTDPLSGTVLDVGRTHYRPPAGLRDLVQARDRQCAFPGCTVPAQRCDIDHITPWSQGGTTSLDNLTSLCEAHHRLKHTPGWTLTRQDDGALLWTTPTGVRYRRAMDGTITMMAHKIGPRQLAVPARPIPKQLSSAVNDAVVDRLQHGLDLAVGPGEASRPPVVASRGPHPGQPVGAFESVPYPQALHDLGLAPLLDQIPPF